MTQTISINLGGLLFHIDDEAFKLLDNYIKAVERQFASEAEKAEIIADIEARIAELLAERIDRKKDLVTRKEVEQIMEIMGEPQSFRDEDEPQAERGRQYFKRNHSTKRMYRDIDSRILGGVCSGLGAYFRMDPWVFRILFIVFTFFFMSGFVIYLILWITIPEAITTAQKLEMNGQPIDIENIKNKVKEEFENVRNRMNL